MLCTGAEMKKHLLPGGWQPGGAEPAFWRSRRRGCRSVSGAGALSLMQKIYAFQRSAWCATLTRAITHNGGRGAGAAVETVLHHHAHAAACWRRTAGRSTAGDAIALTLDGDRHGRERTARCGVGSCLRVNYLACERLGGLPAVALRGGDLAARQPWRNLLAHCLAFVLTGSSTRKRARFRRENWPLWQRRSGAASTRRRPRPVVACFDAGRLRAGY